MSGARVNVVAKRYAFGLQHSRAIVTAALAEAGCEVQFVRTNGLVARLSRPIERRAYRPARVNLFLETLVPRLFALAHRQAFVPNQEWFFPDDIPLLRSVEVVICKSRYAERIFAGLGCRVAYTSFTSRDRRLPGARMRRAFLYSGEKQRGVADRLCALWSRHPEWPQLTLRSGDPLPPVTLPNVCVIPRFITDDAMARLQNEHRFHLCLSRAEGFGHKLNEALSCGAIVIATDGPPMNELIAPGRGLLVRAERSEPLGVGAAYDFDEADLERTIDACVRMTTAEIARLSDGARAWFEENDRFFRREFARVVRTFE